MSIDGTKLLFEGFLQKRKDTMKLRWATYWFRLQNTTLFFYTKENCSASHLRGYYYIYTVQSVREVQKADSKRFMFEIIMTNGKRKLLAAETAALREEWVGHLWQAMNLSTSGVSDFRNTHLESQRDRIHSTLPVCSQSDSVLESLPARPLSAPVSLIAIGHETRSIASPVCLPEEPDQNILLACNSQNDDGDSLDSPQRSSESSNAEGRPENDYDVLPMRKNICRINDSTEQEEGVYDYPLSHRRAAEHTEQTESIYDVPSSLLRRLSDHSSEEEPVGGIYWRI
uniref:uncharacterized protein n=1 Tax=Semicossyphus pulcher TaxID=241346 RepID=UPI0037E74A33